MPYIELENISLHYNEAGIGDPPVLLLHELGGSSESWRHVIPLIAPHRRAIALDLRCAGRSEKPTAAFEMTDVVADIAGLLDALHIGRVDVIGAALGAMVAALLASRHPALIRRMVLCAVADTVDQRTRDYVNQRAEHLRKVGMRAVADSSLANAFPEPHGAARAAQRPIYLANDPAGYAEMSQALARMSVTPELWRSIKCPTLVMSGRHDFIWPPEAGRRVAGSLPGAEFIELTDAAHFPHIQTPEALTEAALRFLARTSP